jgi:sulfur carrier protein
MSFSLILNGQDRTFDGLVAPVSLAQFIAELQLKGDRIAVEHNGAIVERARWPETNLAPGDRLEVVHFVGGGSGKMDGYIVPKRPGTKRPVNAQAHRSGEIKGLPAQVER